MRRERESAIARKGCVLCLTLTSQPASQCRLKRNVKLAIAGLYLAGIRGRATYVKQPALKYMLVDIYLLLASVWVPRWVGLDFLTPRENVRTTQLKTT